jgi:hypothetical protein
MVKEHRSNGPAVIDSGFGLIRSGGTISAIRFVTLTQLQATFAGVGGLEIYRKIFF